MSVYLVLAILSGMIPIHGMISSCPTITTHSYLGKQSRAIRSANDVVCFSCGRRRKYNCKFLHPNIRPLYLSL